MPYTKEKIQQYLGDDVIICSEEIVFKAKDKIDLKCLKDNTLFSPSVSNVIFNNSSCPTCAKTQRPVSKTYTTDTFIRKAVRKHGSLYNYTKVHYTNHETPVEIVCSLHGSFFQRPSLHLMGSGCSVCAVERRKYTTDQFIEAAIRIHGDQYDYSNVVFERTDRKVAIECKNHGLFFQTPFNHLQGWGCISCGRTKASAAATMTTKTFISKAQAIHGNRYDYSEVVYKNTKQKVKILCKIHGHFFQQPNCHLQGQRCPHCTGFVSRREVEWLDHLNVPNTITTRQVSIPVIDGTISVDGFDPISNTVYEFWGDFWHGNPSVFDPDATNPVTKTSYRELYEKTQIKRRRIVDSGYKLVEVWEHDWIMYQKRIM